MSDETTVPDRMETTTVPLSGWEEFKAAYIAAREAERGSLWLRGDMIARFLKLNGENKEGRRVFLGEVAALEESTISWVKQLATIASSFGTEYRMRNQMKPWSLFRSCVHAAKRTGRTAQDILEEAHDKNWHVPDVNLLGTSKKRRLSLKKTCDACGLKVSLSVGGESAKTFRGLALVCPGCATFCLTDGKDAREADKLGALA